MSSGPRRRFFFISSIWGWGGSEELWSGAAATLAAEGHDVGVFKQDAVTSVPQLERLRGQGCHTGGRIRLPAFSFERFRTAIQLARPYIYALQHLRLYLRLRLGPRPDLIVLSQGGNSDGLSLARTFLSLGIPYAVISHKATDLYWPVDGQRARLRALYTGAQACFFVSEHTLRVTEEQIATALPRAQIVRNPFFVSWKPRTDWPDESDGLRLACIGRLYTMEKGQDILLRVMAREKWRARPLHVTFYGEGINREGLGRMANYLRLTNVSFGGYDKDVAGIWGRQHGLILPSRCEGLPLVVVEAMLSGRVPILSDVGGNREVVDDGTTGFLASAPTEDALDAAMERAWARRAEWRAIGAAASARIRTLVPEKPIAVMVSLLEGLAEPASEPQHAPLMFPQVLPAPAGIAKWGVEER
ncbi:MAG: glycosyltransferase family 4 protein [Gemmatimonadota bacterium]